MPSPGSPKSISLPRHWTQHLRSGVLHAISLAQAALTHAWGRAATQSSLARHQSEIDRLRAESQAGVNVVRTPDMAPNANAFAERFVLSIKSGCLERMIFFGRSPFRKAVGEYIAHYNGERHHQGIDSVPTPRSSGASLGRVRSHERLGGLLRHYSRAAA